MEPLDETSRNNLFLIDNTANPAPLGLCAFGLTTILLSLHNAGVIALSSAILSMALLYGGSAQIIVGAMEWKKKNTFGLLTFGSFGFFWIALATLMMLPAVGLAKAAAPVDLAAFLGLWGLFTIGLFICSLAMHRVLQAVLFLLVVTFFLLVAAQLTGSGLILVSGGVVGILTGMGATYLGFGQVINEVYGTRKVPI